MGDIPTYAATKETTLRERVIMLEKENAELRENIQHSDNLIEIIQRHIREIDLQVYGPQDECAKEVNK